MKFDNLVETIMESSDDMKKLAVKKAMEIDGFELDPGELAHRGIYNFVYATDNDEYYELYATPDWDEDNPDEVDVQFYMDGEELNDVAKVPTEFKFKATGNAKKDLASYIKGITPIIKKAKAYVDKQSS